MTDQSDSLEVGSAVELLQQTELSEIRTYRLQAERVTRESAQDADTSVSTRSEPGWLEVRCRIVIPLEDADLIVDRSAVFTHARPLAVPEPVVKEFTEKVGVMTVYPYLREGAFTLARNLGVEPPVMALVRSGSVSLSARRDAAVPVPVDSASPE